ncbi:hypothetical protein B0H14DRAFT_3429933 [Mycena olivaceomarginata]|nr:hypothetical protein B0H14DRAFT_3429933 [Mycena olivaceomarginata]
MRIPMFVCDTFASGKWKHFSNKHHCTFAGLDLPLFMLFVHGGIAVGWVAALSVLSTGVVPIYFRMSQFGLQHQAITNVIITGIATLSTTHLLLTIKSRPDSMR